MDPQPRQADACITREPGVVCAVMTADCLPVLFCSDDGREVAAAHAGWRGLCGGVLENTLAQFQAPPDRIHAWLGPAIGPDAFEVGAEVRRAFMDIDPRAADAFRPVGDKFLPISGIWPDNACRPQGSSLSVQIHAAPSVNPTISSPTVGTGSPGVWQL